MYAKEQIYVLVITMELRAAFVRVSLSSAFVVTHLNAVTLLTSKISPMNHMFA